MALILDIKVVPLSGRCAWKLDKNGTLKCYLKSEPEKGRANRELIELLSRALGIPQAQITLISGATQRLKKVKIDANMSYDQVLSLVGIDKQDRQVGIFEE